MAEFPAFTEWTERLFIKYQCISSPSLPNSLCLSVDDFYFEIDPAQIFIHNTFLWKQLILLMCVSDIPASLNPHCADIDGAAEAAALLTCCSCFVSCVDGFAWCRFLSRSLTADIKFSRQQILKGIFQKARSCSTPQIRWASKKSHNSWH